MKTSVNTHKKKIYRVRYIYPRITAWFPLNQEKLETYLYPTIIFNVQNLENEEMEKIHEFLNGKD